MSNLPQSIHAVDGTMVVAIVQCPRATGMGPCMFSDAKARRLMHMNGREKIEEEED